jgi:hypothetical protein
MSWLADAVLVLHAGFVVFILGGLVLIWLGGWLRWRWVRNYRFRLAHLAAIVFVALEAVVGIACPLTVLEDWLRNGPEQAGGFIERWLHRLLYWDFEPWIFTATYLGFAAIVLATFLLFPPIRRNRA